MRACLPGVLLLFLSACAAYPAAPVRPSPPSSATRHPSLDDPALAAFLSARGTQANSRWNVETLTLAALYHDAMPRKARPLLPSRLENTARAVPWTLRRRIREALLNYYAALQEADILTRKTAVRSAPVEKAQSAALVRLRNSRDALATLVGVSVQEISPARLDFYAIEHPPGLIGVPLSALRAAALLNRPDLRQALADFAHDARLAGAPAVPAYYWDGGRWALDGLLPAPPAGQNASPPGAARLRGDAATVEALQDRILDDVGYRWQVYRERLAFFDAARDQLGSYQMRLRTTRKGGRDAGGTAAGRQLIDLQQHCLAALVLTQEALGSLENALRTPLTDGNVPALLARTGMLPAPRREQRPLSRGYGPARRENQPEAAAAGVRRSAPRPSLRERSRVFLIRNARPYPSATWE